MATRTPPAAPSGDTDYATTQEAASRRNRRIADASLAYMTAGTADWDLPAVRGLLERCLALLPGFAERESTDLARLIDSLSGSRPLSPREAATILNVSSPNTVKAWARRGLFPHAWRTIGGHWRIPLDDCAAVSESMGTARDFARTLMIPRHSDPVEETPG